MAFEQKSGMQGPMTIAIRASKAAEKDGNQLKGKYPPHKDLPKWYCTCSEPSNASISVYSAQQPKGGDTHLEAWVDGNEHNGKWYYELYTKEDKAKKDSGGGGRGGLGGGAKPNYSLEQEAMRDGQKAAIDALCGGLEGKDGMMKLTLPNIRLVAAALAKDIIEAGKKPETT